MAKPFKDELKILPSRDWADVECAHDDEPLQTKDSEQVRRWLSSGDSSGSSIKKLVPKRAMRSRARGNVINTEDLMNAIEAVVAPLRREITALKAAIKEPIASEPDEFEKWIQSEDARKYAGEFIACTGPGKVVAHAPIDDDLMDMIANYPKKQDLIVDRVPDAKE